MALATTKDERQYILQQLHIPTMDLRRRQQQPPLLQQRQRQRQLIISKVVDDDTLTTSVVDSLQLHPPIVDWNETNFLNELSWNITTLRKQNKKHTKVVARYMNE